MNHDIGKIVQIVNELEDIDEISNGRLILGLGSGAINTNRKWHNSPLFDKPTERMGSFYQLFRKIEEYVSLTKRNTWCCQYGYI